MTDDGKVARFVTSQRTPDRAKTRPRLPFEYQGRRRLAGQPSLSAGLNNYFFVGTCQGETKCDSDCHPSGFEQHHSTPSSEPHEDRKNNAAKSAGVDLTNR